MNKRIDTKQNQDLTTAIGTIEVGELDDVTGGC